MEHMQEGAAVSAQNRQATILVVEDEPAIRSLTVRILSALGYRTVEASSGAEALRICQSGRQQVDLIMTDMVMPNGSGSQFINELHKTQEGLRVLFVSGYTDQGEKLGDLVDPSVHADFMAKPFTRETLAEKIRTLLAA